MRRIFACCAALTWVAGYACSSADSRKDVGAGRQINTGSVRVSLELAQGVLVTAVNYEITGSGTDPMDGVFALGGGHGSGFIGVVNGIPAGRGRQVALTANASGGIKCAGSATFDVEAKKTSTVDVMLECRGTDGTVIVRGTFEQCPLLKSISASPDSVAVGETIALVAVVNDPQGDATRIAWTATSGSFADASATSTTYSCSSAGSPTITAKVSKKDGSCSDSTSFSVTCKSPPDAGAVCGNGHIDPGEDCDKTDLGGATCASATMNALPTGILACGADCKFDMSGCSGGSGGGAGGSGGTPGAGGTGGIDAGPGAGGAG